MSTPATPPKGVSPKVEFARPLSKETTLSLKRIASQWRMESRSCVSQLILWAKKPWNAQAEAPLPPIE